MSQPVTFTSRAERLLGTGEAAAVDRGMRYMADRRQMRIDELPISDGLRDRARAVRIHALSHLDRLLGHFADRVTALGGEVHFASDAAEANQIIGDILRAEAAELVVKAKSMVTEEIELNEHLERSGHRVVETDLGEFIAQLAGEPPSHIIAPVLHKTRRDVGELFAEKLGIEPTDDPVRLNAAAREHLRPVFLQADAGISGVNMAVAESGSLVLVTNEGNGRMVTSAPPVHIAVMGMERIVARWEDAGVILEVLARSATGQRMSVYTNVVTGPRRDGDPDGPDRLHVVVVDNGRSEILAGENAEILACIRCGACLNICPVFRTVGGHAYGTVYSGPVGSVVTPGLHGMDPWWDLPFASTMCGACQDVCPVRIEIPRMLLNLRRQAVDESRLPGWLGRGLSAYARAATQPARWARAKRWAHRLSGFFAARGWLRRVPGPARGWTRYRDFPRPAKQSFAEWWETERET
ncbi:MAG: LutB/LldF family L-lactate oxidation iron-sulfur protein [Acidimicrobiia bacterium]|nr:LutB/LldF family L-lactate oxidation iron-sulfur protein [Acidimicrobiia bacterium]